MSWKFVHPEEYELSRETAHEAQPPNEIDGGNDDGDDNTYESHLLTGQNVAVSKGSVLLLLLKSLIPRSIQLSTSRRRSKRRRHSASWTCSRRTVLGKFVLLSDIFLLTVIALTFTCAVFFPSYTRLPPHYRDRLNEIRSSKALGRGNPTKEKVFIAASIYDPGGDLVGGAWGKNVLDLVDLLGPQNVFSEHIRERFGSGCQKALQDFGEQIACNHSLRFDDHIGLETLPRVTLLTEAKKVKRIAYLAEVRNRALIPLATSELRFDKLLYLNDVVFHPVDVIQLLFSTNADHNGQAQYRAACAVDFINPFKFYDTFATRDIEGYSMGVPFFPWFSAAGDAQSRREVINGKDAVQVRSCWGGMVAFDAKYFQASEELDHTLETAASRSPMNISHPYRFRAEEDLFWDASECCLIHADIQDVTPGETGVYMNPFVRVAYDVRTLSWLQFTRRFERLYSPIHFLIDILAGLPHYNARRDESPWHQVEETVWIPDPRSPSGGHFKVVQRIANHAGFCGRRNLQVMKDTVKKGERNWEMVPIPS